MMEKPSKKTLWLIVAAVALTALVGYKYFGLDKLLTLDTAMWLMHVNGRVGQGVTLALRARREQDRTEAGIQTQRDRGLRA